MSESNSKESKAKKDSKTSPVKFVGLDIGTSYVVSAYEEDGAIKYSHIRSAFLGLEPKPSTKKMLQNLGHAFINTEDRIFLVGEPAIGLANIFSEEVQRPMKRGILSPGETEAIDVMRILIKEVLKGITDENTIVAYSSPADPVDGSFSTQFHRNLMKSILTDPEKGVGVKKAVPMNEAHALGFSELADDGFTGLCFSFGAGMVNAVLSFAGLDALQFSIPNGGDWIDHNAAYALGITDSQMQAKKEDPSTDISEPKTMEDTALRTYYEALINQAVDSFNSRFASQKDKPQLNSPIPVVVAGGTTLAKGFLDLFQSVVDEKGLPFEVKGKIRHAKDPLRAVAEGLLLAAMNEE